MRLERATPLGPADRQIAWAVFALLLALYTATMSTPFDNPDAEVEYQTARSIALARGFALGDDTPEGAALREARFNVREGPDGELYSWFGVGQALVAVPLWWIGRGVQSAVPELEHRHVEGPTHMGVPRSEYASHLAVAWRNPLLAAWTAALIFACARRVRVSRPAAFAAALAYGVTTFAWPQARSSLSDVQGTFLVVLATFAWMEIRGGFRRLERPTKRALLLFGAAVGLGVLTRIALAPALLVLVVAATGSLVRGHVYLRTNPLLRGRTRAADLSRDLALAAAPALVAAAFLLWVNHHRFGDVFETGYGEALGGFHSYPPLLGAAGLLFSPGRGLVWFAPLLLLLPVGLVRIGEQRTVIATLLAVAIANAAVVAPALGWHGGWTFGPRYVLPAVALSWIPVAAAFEALWRAGLSRFTTVPLAAFGLVANLGGVLVEHTTHTDLAIRAARIEWPVVEGTSSEREADDLRFLNILWDGGFAAPWAHWRILRHRVAGLGEEFPVRAIFGVESDARLVPAHERDRGFAHLAWRDFGDRLGGRPSTVLALCAALAALGAVAAIRALDPTRP